jgi:hypothetical protein
MVEIVYVSAAVTPLSEAHLGVLLSRARSSNALLGVTGMLLYDRGSFMQVVEGAHGAVDWLFEKIGKDIRHHRVTRLSRTPITKRSFDGWSMAYVSVDRQRAAQVSGFSDLFGARFSVASFLENPASKTARDFLLAFRGGRFRSHVEV